MGTDIIIIVVLILLILIIWHRSNEEKNTDFGVALHDQTIKLPEIQKDAPVEHYTDPEDKITNMLYNRRFERMSSPMKNAATPLYDALHGGSALGHL